MPAPTFLGARLAVPCQRVSPNPAVDLDPFGRWTLPAPTFHGTVAFSYFPDRISLRSAAICAGVSPLRR